MKKAKPKRRPKRKPFVRSRDKPVTIYFNATEFSNLERKAAANGCTKSDWIRKRVNAEPRARKAAPPPVQEDPRQVRLEDVLEEQLASLRALREAAS